MQQLPSFAVALRHDSIKADELARRLRLDNAAVFGRIEQDSVLLDVRTIRDEQIAAVARAVETAARVGTSDHASGPSR
jgi:seryl-tRNA(Sec) selenium transferase